MGALLLGRRTYEDFYAVWPGRKDSAFSAILDSMQKYVASTTLSEPLAWSNSTLLKGEIAQAVSRLKGERDTDLVVMGSGELVRSLMQSHLIDEYVLLIHPPGWKMITCAGTGRAAWLRRLSQPRACDTSSTPATPSSILTAGRIGSMPARPPPVLAHCSNLAWMPKPP